MKKVIITLTIFSALLMAENYNPYKAVKYAKTHTLDTKHIEDDCDDPRGDKKDDFICPTRWSGIYKKYTGIKPWDLEHIFTEERGSDCTNFISQTLHMGGVSYDFSNKWYHRKNEDGYRWVRVRSFRDMFLDDKFSSSYQVSKSNVRIGDVIFFHNKDDYPNSIKYTHACIVTKIYHNDIYYTAHSRDRVNYSLNELQDVNHNAYNFEFWRIVSKFRPVKYISLNETLSPVELQHNGMGASLTDYNAIESLNRPNHYAHSFGLKITECTNVQIDMEDLGDNIDPYLYLMKDGVVKYEDDDHGSGRNSKIVARLNPGVYEIESTTYSARKTGNYKLSVKKLSSCSESSNSYPKISLNSTTNSSLHSGLKLSKFKSGTRRGYAKTYQFTLTKTTTVKIKSDMSRSMDSYLYLMDSNGKKITEDDDKGGDRDSYIERKLLRGTYLIEVTTYKEGKTGNFKLSLTK